MPATGPVSDRPVYSSVLRNVGERPGSSVSAVLAIDVDRNSPQIVAAIRDNWCLRLGELTVTETPQFEGKLGLADFLSDLRAELDEAARRAEGESLKLEIDQVTLSLDVAFTIGKKGEGSAAAKAKFWVFASAEVNAKGELSSQRVNTQHLSLTLKPQIEDIWVDESGVVQRFRRKADVSGEVGSDEENPA